MIEVTLPVAPISRKILLADYGPEPIQFNRHDTFFSQIFYRKPNPRSNLGKLNQLLTAEIRILLNKQYAHNIAEDGFQIGDHLFNYHMDRMLNFIYSQRLINEPAQQALHLFYEIHGIEEDDFQFDSAYKRWVRYWRKKKNKETRGIFAAQKQRNGGYEEKSIERSITIHIPLRDSQIDRIIYQVCAELIDDFYTAGGKFRNTFLKQMVLYAYYRIGRRKKEYICEKYDVTRRILNYSINTFSDFLEVQPQAEELFKQAVACETT